MFIIQKMFRKCLDIHLPTDLINIVADYLSSKEYNRSVYSRTPARLKRLFQDTSWEYELLNDKYSFQQIVLRADRNSCRIELHNPMSRFQEANFDLSLIFEDCRSLSNSTEPNARQLLKSVCKFNREISNTLELWETPVLDVDMTMEEIRNQHQKWKRVTRYKSEEPMIGQKRIGHRLEV